MDQSLDSQALQKNPFRLGPYFIGKTIGTGTSGKVKIGVHSETGQKVAVKIIAKDSKTINNSSEHQKILEKEITIMKLIEHPNIMQLYDVYESSKALYTYFYCSFLVLEYVEGGELFDYLIKRGRLPEKEAREVFIQIVTAVEYCHRCLVWYLILNSAIVI
jgi:serine/threonine protein kinase